MKEWPFDILFDALCNYDLKISNMIEVTGDRTLQSKFIEIQQIRDTIVLLKRSLDKEGLFDYHTPDQKIDDNFLGFICEKVALELKSKQ